MRKNIYLSVMVILIMLISSSCSSNDRYINMVKEGYLEQYPNVTIGEVFDNSFIDGKWSYTESMSVQDKEKHNVVEFEGNYDLYGENTLVKFSFYIDDSSQKTSVFYDGFVEGNLSPLEMLFVVMDNYTDNDRNNYQITKNDETIRQQDVLLEDEESESFSDNPDDIYYIMKTPIWGSDFLRPYIDEAGIDIDEMWNIANKLFQTYFKLDTSEGNYVRKSTGLISEDYYTITREKTNMFYTGGLKDNKPEGFGAIFEGIEYEVNGSVEVFIHNKYMGYFKEGRPDGQGIYIKDLPDSNTVNNFLLRTEMHQAFIDEYLSPIEYIGEFKKGHYSGKGVLFEYPDLELMLGMKSSSEALNYDFNTASDQFNFNDINVYYGSFKDGMLDGHVDIYYKQKLFYSGNAKKNQINGKGTLYFIESDKIQYEGEFKNGKYDGKGTLYDENGNVIYSGKWSVGDYSD